MAMVLERELPETGRIMNFGAYKLRGYKGVEYRYHIASLGGIVAHLSKEVFDIDPNEAGVEVIFNMRNGGSIIIATLSDSNESIAYSTQRILQPTIRTTRPRVLCISTYISTSISTRLPIEEYRDERLRTALIQFANALHGGPDIIGGRTQNPAVVRSYYQSDLFRTIYPFDRTYGESQSMQEVLRYVVSQTKHRYPVDERTGLVPAVYKEGKSRAYDNEKASPEVQAIYDRMINEFRLDPDRGDAIYVMGPTVGRSNFVE